MRLQVADAMSALAAQGYVCKARWKCCAGCGWAGLPDEADAPRVVFWHQQSHDRIADGEPLFLQWRGDGAVIASALAQAGLEVLWDGKASTCIAVRPKSELPVWSEPALAGHFVVDEYEEARSEASARLRRRPSRIKSMTADEWRQFTDQTSHEVSGRWAEPTTDPACG